MELFENKLTRFGEETAITRMSGVEETQVGPPLAYGGTNHHLNPEELFVASINSCLMLVFYHFAKQRKVEIARYDAEAVGKVEKTPNGLRFTEVRVNANVSLDNPDQSDEVTKLTDLAEKYCLISNSLNCPVRYRVSLEENAKSMN